MVQRVPADVTKLLDRWKSGERQALDELLPLVYQELRRLARNHLRQERPDHTLQPTAVVHEAYFRLAQQDVPAFQNRCHFFAIAAQVMRQVLVDHARYRGAQKRGGGFQKITLDQAALSATPVDLDLLQLDHALNALAKLDARQSRIVELRFFSGLSIEETADVMEISPATVNREWTTARAWLHRELARGSPT